MTEHEILILLAQRFANGDYGALAPRYVFATHVRNAAGFSATNEFDAVVVDTWESSGLTVEIIEVKVTRSDWLNELKKLPKTQAAINAGNLFSIAAPKGVVKADELKDGWGWYEISAKGALSCKRKPKQHTLSGTRSGIGMNHYIKWEPLPRSFAVALLRAVERTARFGKTYREPAAEADQSV